jgi:hypothetical protein
MGGIRIVDGMPTLAVAFPSDPHMSLPWQWHLPAILTLMAIHKISKEEAEEAVLAADGGPEPSWMSLACTRYSISEIANGPSK